MGNAASIRNFPDDVAILSEMASRTVPVIGETRTAGSGQLDSTAASLIGIAIW